jgi:hypothetical protein
LRQGGRAVDGQFLEGAALVDGLPVLVPACARLRKSEDLPHGGHKSRSAKACARGAANLATANSPADGSPLPLFHWPAQA